MRILFLFLCVFLGFILGRTLYYFFQYVSSKKDANTDIGRQVKPITKNNLEKTDLDYWYQKPHYFILPCGKKINLAEYLTYKEYKEIKSQQYSWTSWVNYMDSKFSKEIKENNML